MNIAQQSKVIKNKVSLFQLAEQPDSIFKACKVMGVSRHMTGDRSLSRALCFASVGTLRIDYSVKYMAQTFTALVHRPSFTQIRQWTDARDDVDMFADEA